MASPDNDAYVRAVHDKGLRFDLRTMSRRRMLAALGGAAGLLAVGGTAACSEAEQAATATTGGATGSADAGSTEIESETAGPYPADGTNGPDVRTESGIVRSDIRSSFGSASGTADGVPLEFHLVVQDLDGAPVTGAAVYAWHCDREGRYSLYSQGVTDQNYLRGIQQTDDTGTVTFTSIFPACYAGRWPHIHFEVYASLGTATSGAGPIVKTSQMAIPEDAARAVYATAGYGQSVTNMSNVTLATDNVFGDDSAATELGTVTGSVSAGYVATLRVPVDPSGTEEGGGEPGGGPPGGDGGPAPGGA
ncbi:dioxygenase family protein [Mangrovihabitans endophyticus]|uniref:3,4-dioxygenase subunit beta n=1 Tax=Mangrovihabitans endophyticus TaxID=1751298 RepID=A0A8J3BYH2_9ACTN|nr:intradiol ring-cleavage dioxygenase [Mangrovihabitans endophyticus]GGK80455.1 3,4-dioxygenase subunit beta [Mangrovihabitans endophyticus]